MIINSNTPSYSNIAPAHGKHGKHRAESRKDGDETQGASTSSADDELSVSNQNLISANPPLQDVNAVLASLKSASQSMLSQPSLAMLAQAGSLPQNAAQLLQE